MIGIVGWLHPIIIATIFSQSFGVDWRQTTNNFVRIKMSDFNNNDNESNCRIVKWSNPNLAEILQWLVIEVAVKLVHLSAELRFIPKLTFKTFVCYFSDFFSNWYSFSRVRHNLLTNKVTKNARQAFQTWLRLKKSEFHIRILFENICQYLMHTKELS